MCVGQTPLVAARRRCTRAYYTRHKYSSHCIRCTAVKLSTVSSRAFEVAAPHIGNTQATEVVEGNSLSTFSRLLKLFFIQAVVP